MGDGLASELYAEWRRTQDTGEPVWGNLNSEQRESWERVANLARRTMARRFVDSLETARVASESFAVALSNVRARWER